MNRMRKRTAVLVAAAALCLSSSPAAWASAVTGRVTKVQTRASDGLQLVEVDGARSAAPSCATHLYFIIRDERSDAGKAQYAMLMAAWLADKVVTIHGQDVCSRWGDGEDILAVTYGR
ncbi:hypothetical protein [Sphingomonas phyllosphaerae]|uniref:hypothetical protein n=1 Tax=Sphingomonas phyllosphaerae TaxID=257003 RepID=UPI0003B5ABFC|nr:hypothetical protein [Sphingomonas phyllosphaerae]